MQKRARTLLVWLHVVTSVGWLSQAVALLALVLYGMKTGDLTAFKMARYLDHEVLAIMANTSAFSGFMLSATTPWGYFRHWWVLAKFVITVSQLYVGIFILSGNLQEAVNGHVTAWMPVGTSLMIGAIAFQAWLSVAKPWRRTPWADPKVKLPTASTATFVVALVIPVIDFAISLWRGNPMPLLMLITVIGYSVRRAARARRRSSAASGRGSAADPARRDATAPSPR
ncbi:hypothetical protein SAMN04488074_11357 [Lentzea albidocapillata subsp. violacea]|uniref:Uncharacterized protein n=1 Tax=Lentzea albidocapillata subsp. violacea TaxID=128104 RepID=A0A1G9MK17_9PSEU|nr:hypothetical protein [Lentzea albidocapillata]SDL74630.1 hypothetical protein SAMN04488074_11357 [Lentzea albidocapillata subsp. violacea]